MSTGTYVAALVWNRSQVNRLVPGVTNQLLSTSYDSDGFPEITAYEDVVRKQSWMAVISVMLNCLIGDAIVWWRVFHKPQVISTTSVTVLGITNANNAGNAKNACVLISAILSLAINTLATALIAYKMWVLNALALLVESGSIYCALKLFVILYETDPTPSQTPVGVMFARVAECFIYGCITPLMAIYPTIIVLVALKRSPIDTGGLSQVHLPRGSGAGAGAIDKGTESTIVFHHSTIRMVASTGGPDLDDAIAEGIWTSDPPANMQPQRWTRNMPRIM
ncbi:hypothetical protein V8D89_009826 [Ganoderma adspersum]